MRASARPIVLSLAAGLGLAAAGPARGDLLTNGSFETAAGEAPSGTVAVGTSGGLPTDAIVGWTVGGTGARWVANGGSPGWPAFAGTRSLALNGQPSGESVSYGNVSQTITTVPGTTYTVSFALAGYPLPFDGGDEETLTSLRLTAVSGATTSTPFVIPASSGGMNWATQTFNFTAETTTTTLIFSSLTDSDFGPVVDDVSVFVSGSAPTGPDGESETPPEEGEPVWNEDPPIQEPVGGPTPVPAPGGLLLLAAAAPLLALRRRWRS